MKSFPCWFGLHKWGPWRDSGKSKTVETWSFDGMFYDDGPYLSEEKILEHTCERCGVTK